MNKDNMSEKNGSHLLLMVEKAWRANLIPGIVIQVFAIILVGSYYLLPEVAVFWNSLAVFKQDYSLLFAMASTGICGGLIPYIYQYFTGKVNRSMLVAGLTFVLLFWGVKGGEIELFYRFQALMFGDNNAFFTIVEKVVVDQFIYNPLWAAHTVLIPLIWQHCDFNLKKTAQALSGKYWTELFPGMLISTWLVWVPAVSIVYCLPQALQIPLFNLVLCFFVLLASSLKKS